MMIYKLAYAVIILIYAIIAMTLLLGVYPARLASGKKRLFFIAMPLIVVGSIFFMLFFLERFMPLYPILVHLPIVIVFCMVTGRGLVKVLFVLFTAIFLTYPPSFVYLMTEKLPGLTPVLPVVFGIVACALTIAAVCRYMTAGFTYVMEHLSTKEILKLCTVPLGYNLLNYLIGKYSMYSSLSTLRIILFFSALGVYLLLLNVMKNAQNMQALQVEKEILGTQLQTAQRQFEQLKFMQEKTVTYRHDMRHHLSFLSGLATDGDIDKMNKYLAGVLTDIDAMTPVSYCKNDTINLIFVSFATKAKQLGVRFSVDANLPQTLTFPDTELCILFSNGLENAITAATMASEPFRTVQASCYLHKKNLLILIENHFEGDVIFENNLPKSLHKGHGFGTKSMVMIANKYDGYCSFTAVDNVFTLKIALPLKV